MEVILVVTLSMDDPDGITKAITAINPPGIPHFAGVVLVAVEEDARRVVEWLTEDVPGNKETV